MREEEKKLLLLTQDHQTISIIEKLVFPFSFSFVVVSNWEESFKILQSPSSFDGLLIDCAFFDTALKNIQEIKNSIDYEIPIFILLENLEEKSLFLFKNSISDFMIKPIEEKEFFTRLFFLLSKDIHTKNPKKIISILEEKLRDITTIYNGIQSEYEKIQKSMEEKEENFYTMAHDLKSPLNNITMGIDLFLMTVDYIKEEDRETLLEVKNTAIRINQMVVDFLEKVKQEKTAEMIYPDYFNPAIIIEILLREFYPLANSKQITLMIEAEEHPKQVYWDQNQILRVISNILDNAIKYTPPKGTIEVSFKQFEDHSIFEIKDNGIGIPEEKIDKIFNIFYQTKKENKGFGIGLAFCKKMIEKHNGSILVQSKVNQGTRVKITLPNSVF